MSNKTPKLYHVRIFTEDGEEWGLFASDAETVEEATAQAKQSLIKEDIGYSEEDEFELYEEDEVSGYKVTLTKM